jgi:hypothetical protein
MRQAALTCKNVTWEYKYATRDDIGSEPAAANRMRSPEPALTKGLRSVGGFVVGTGTLLEAPKKRPTQQV